MNPHDPDIGDPEALAIATAIATEKARMTPCTCNTEMGDTCVKCAPKPAPVVLTLDGDAFLWPSGRKAIWPIRHGAAWMARADYTDILPPCQEHPTAEAAAGALGALLPAPAPTATPEPDRSSWPVLVKVDDDSYAWQSGRDAVYHATNSRWWAFADVRPCAESPDYPTPLAAADAIRARLPDEVSEAARTVAPQPPPPDPRDAEIVTLAREATELRETIEKQGEEIVRLSAALQGTKVTTFLHDPDLRWSVVRDVVAELGDVMADYDATVPASVVRVALAAIRAVVP